MSRDEQLSEREERMISNVWRMSAFIQQAEHVGTTAEMSPEVQMVADQIRENLLDAINQRLDEPVAPSVLARFSNQSVDEVLRWMSDGLIWCAETELGQLVRRREVVEFSLARLEMHNVQIGSDVVSDQAMRAIEQNRPVVNLFDIPAGPWLVDPRVEVLG